MWSVRRMTERIFCSMLFKDDVELKGSTLTLSFSDEKHTFYLSDEALDKIRDELNRRRDYEMNEHRQQVAEGMADWAVDENA